MIMMPLLTSFLFTGSSILFSSRPHDNDLPCSSLSHNKKKVLIDIFQDREHTILRLMQWDRRRMDWERQTWKQRGRGSNDQGWRSTGQEGRGSTDRGWRGIEKGTRSGR